MFAVISVLRFSKSKMVWGNVVRLTSVFMESSTHTRGRVLNKFVMWAYFGRISGIPPPPRYFDNSHLMKAVIRRKHNVTIFSKSVPTISIIILLKCSIQEPK